MPDQPQPTISFGAFVFSIASNAAVMFGDIPDPVSNQTRPPDLEGASQLIEILGMLQDKTRGNLTPDEQQLLEGVLYELRMRYVEAGKPKSSIILP